MEMDVILMINDVVRYCRLYRLPLFPVETPEPDQFAERRRRRKKKYQRVYFERVRLFFSFC